MNNRKFFDQVASTWDDEVNEDTERKIQEIIRAMNIQPGDRVLDVGAGTGILLSRFATGQKFALEPSSEMIRSAKKKFSKVFPFVQGEAEAIPFIGKFFDCVVCFRSFPHFGSKNLALREISRVLVKNGRLYIAHPASRVEVNTFHKKIGGAVACDRLPDNFTMRKILSGARFSEIKFVNGKRIYLVSALKI